MDRLTTGIAQRLCQRGQELRVDDEKQILFRRDNGMVRLTGCKGKNRIDIRVFEIRIILKNALSRLSSRQQTQNIRDGNTQSANARPIMHAVGIYRDPRQEV